MEIARYSCFAGKRSVLALHYSARGEGLICDAVFVDSLSDCALYIPVPLSRLGVIGCLYFLVLRLGGGALLLGERQGAGKQRMGSYGDGIGALTEH